MTIFKSFLSSIRPQAVIFGVAVLCFGAVSLLLRFPSAFFWYSFLLLLAFTILYWVFQWLRYSEKYRNVQHEYALEGDYTALEQLYLAKVAQRKRRWGLSPPPFPCMVRLWPPPVRRVPGSGCSNLAAVRGWR